MYVLILRDLGAEMNSEQSPSPVPRSFGLRDDKKISLELSFGIADRKSTGRSACATTGPKTETPRQSRGAVINRDIVPQR